MPYYTHIINAGCNFDISNKGPFEEFDKEENVDVTWAATSPCLPREL
jgi:hypothetical protein